MYNNNILSLNNLRVQKNIHKKHSDILLLNNLTVPEQIKNAVYYYGNNKHKNCSGYSHREVLDYFFINEFESKYLKAWKEFKTYNKI